MGLGPQGQINMPGYRILRGTYMKFLIILFSVESAAA